MSKKILVLGASVKTCKDYSSLVMVKDLFAMLNLYSDRILETLYGWSTPSAWQYISFYCVLYYHTLALKTQPKYLKEMPSTVIKFIKFISTRGWSLSLWMVLSKISAACEALSYYQSSLSFSMASFKNNIELRIFTFFECLLIQFQIENLAIFHVLSKMNLLINACQRP